MGKPRLLYFTPSKAYQDRLAQTTFEPIVGRIDRWLGHYFDVIEWSSNGDFKQIVQQCRPDFILFDSIVEGFFEHRLALENLASFPEIPRAALCRVDSISPTRGSAFAESMRVGAEVMFCLGDLEMGEAFPESQNAIMYLPWFIDPELCKDYGEEKCIPVLMAGDFESHPCQYPWRAAIKSTLLQHFSALYLKHPGYDKAAQADNPFVVYGEKFFRIINRSFIAPSSGGLNDIVISKQLEIPACRSLLVTHDVAATRLYGFKDLENCLFAQPSDIKIKLDSIIQQPALLRRLTDAGYAHVHAHHSLRSRPQLLQWFELRKNLPAGHQIIQPDPFSDLKVVPIASEHRTFHLQASPAAQELRKIDELLLRDELQGADVLIKNLRAKCLYMADVQLRAAILNLLQGDPERAAEEILRPIDFSMKQGRPNPDPIEWAVLLLAILASRDAPKTMEWLNKCVSIERRELDLVRWLAASAVHAPQSEIARYSQRAFSPNPKSQEFTIHQIPPASNAQILNFLKLVLKRCEPALRIERIVTSHVSPQPSWNFGHAPAPTSQDLQITLKVPPTV